MLTDYKLHQKRHARTMASRSKRLGRIRNHSTINATKINHLSWMANLGAAQSAGQEAQDRQAQESRRTRETVSKHGSKGFIGALKSFFRRTP